MSLKEHSCLSDRPLVSRENDTLDNNTYVDGLFDFILHAETPVTIGIQGGWGSGKTSLINMLQERLREPEEDRTICVFVNAWEHSLLQTQGNKAEVTRSLLQGVLDDMKAAVEKTPDIPKSVKEKVLKEDGLFDKAKKAAVGLAVLGVNAAVKMNFGVDVHKKDAVPETPSMAKVVRELRGNLATAVDTIVQDSDSPNRFVCFIDDLDRVPPETAVEILDVTKNIFDIPNCIFVLAIDYEVVVKGLEAKFGKKTDENEREFRQYFDKIIQIPFTMPVGAYEKQMNKLLEACFTSLGYQFSDAGAAMLENIRNAAMAATDGIPRSVKRIVNTLSLLQRISGRKRGRGEDEARQLNDFEIRFIIVSLHINFPEICRRIMEIPAFTDWKLAQLKERWELEGVDPNKLAAFGESFDEDWEIVLYCLCQKNHWLKTKVFSASMIMKCLRTALQRKKAPAAGKTPPSLTEEETGLLSDVLSDIRVVSVEDIPAPAVDNSKVKTDQITAFCKKLHTALSGKIDGITPFVEGRYYARGNRVKSDRWYSVDINNPLVSELRLEWSVEDDEFYITYIVQEPAGNKIKFKNDLMERCKKNGIKASNKYECYYSFNFTYDKFTSENPLEYVEKAISLFNKVKDIRQALE
jgi:hypothetical protein